jgi:FMN phosphatase YigB (HAD superfamily)
VSNCATGNIAGVDHLFVVADTMSAGQMLRVVFFDLGNTLVDAARQPFPHVKQALTAISSLAAADGSPLRSCLVSDFTLAPPPVTAAKVTALFNEYLAILDTTGLRPFFEPVDNRVTLSTHANALKPDRKIFDKALQRLGASAVPFDECLLITEEPAHIQAVRTKLHMHALQFKLDFDDWALAPGLIANLAASH